MSSSKYDVASIILKGTLGAVPFVGPLAAEIIGTLIPNQRLSRIESFLKILESKIDQKNKSVIEQNISSPESLDLIEDSFIQVSRALSEERKDYIASLLKNSLTDTDLNYIEYKRLLSILGELNDLEILILKSMNLRPHGTVVHEFWVTHGEALTPPRLTIGTAVQRDFDKSAIFKTHNLHLLSLGLIKPVFSRIRDGELPKFDDETGMLHARRYQITDLGKLLLKCIDQN